MSVVYRLSRERGKMRRLQGEPNGKPLASLKHTDVFLQTAVRVRILVKTPAARNITHMALEAESTYHEVEEITRMFTDLATMDGNE